MQHANYQKLAVCILVTTLFTFVSVVSRQFISFVKKMEVYSRQNHEFTTCVHEFITCLGQN